MTAERIRKLVEELRAELDRSGVDEETVDMVRDLEVQVERLANPEVPDDPDSIVELTTLLETRFAARHPVAERFLRDIIEALGQMGI